MSALDNDDLNHLVDLIAPNHELTWTLFVGMRQLRTIQAQLATTGNN